MGLRKILRSKNTWIGAVAGYLGGSWVVGKVRGVVGK